MVRSIITEASNGIGRATAGALVEGEWWVIGVARSSPANFPGVFDLADRQETQHLADDLIARGNVAGIGNNVGVVRCETIGAIDPNLFTTAMDLRGQTLLVMEAQASAPYRQAS